MKVLVATNRTQGEMAGDYTHCVPGELLWITMVCGRDLRDPDGGCGCGRGFGGLTSHRATTTAEVADLDMTEADLRIAVTTSLTDQGWLPPELASEHEEIVTEEIELVRAIAEPLAAGTIVRRRMRFRRGHPAEAWGSPVIRMARNRPQARGFSWLCTGGLAPAADVGADV